MILFPLICFPSVKYLIVSLQGLVRFDSYFSLRTSSFGHSSVLFTLFQLHWPSSNFWKTPNSTPTFEPLLCMFSSFAHSWLNGLLILHVSACHWAREAFSDCPCLESFSYILYYKTLSLYLLFCCLKSFCLLLQLDYKPHEGRHRGCVARFSKTENTKDQTGIMSSLCITLGAELTSLFYTESSNSCTWCVLLFI